MQGGVHLAQLTTENHPVQVIVERHPPAQLITDLLVLLKQDLLLTRKDQLVQRENQPVDTTSQEGIQQVLHFQVAVVTVRVAVVTALPLLQGNTLVWCVKRLVLSAKGGTPQVHTIEVNIHPEHRDDLVLPLLARESNQVVLTQKDNLKVLMSGHVVLHIQEQDLPLIPGDVQEVLIEEDSPVQLEDDHAVLEDGLQVLPK